MKIFCLEHAQVQHKNFAFTLAEVLITLGIIGVVAALTIPGLITNIRHRDYTAKLKKFYSTMNQVIISAEDEYGPVGTWDSTLSYREYAMKYFAPYIKFSFKDKVENTNTIYFNDGTSLRFYKGNCMDIYFDVNGVSLPNKVGYDKFVFLACESKPQYCGDEVNFCTYKIISYGNKRQTWLNKCKENAVFCSTLLKIDNWNFEKDYPYN